MNSSDFEPVARASRRQRKQASRDQQLFELALQHWLDWVLLHHAPRKQGHRPDAAETFELVVRMAKSNTDVSYPTLAQLLRDERRSWDWCASIHAIIGDMTPDHRAIVTGTALGMTQTDIGKAIKMRQPHVCVALSVAQSRFLIRLKLLARTDAICRSVLGYSSVPLQSV